MVVLFHCAVRLRWPGCGVMRCFSATTTALWVLGLGNRAVGFDLLFLLLVKAAVEIWLTGFEFLVSLFNVKVGSCSGWWSSMA